MTPGSTPHSPAQGAAPSLTLPTTLGAFRLEALISRGGAATVYRAVDEAGEPVAVKVLHTRIHEPGVRARFEREASVRIDHPNVVQVRGAGVADGGVAWLAFELLRGEPLSRRLGRGLLRPAEAVRLALDAARGLEAAHERGIVHRDLKPENLFVCEDGRLKVLDFGIALHQDRMTRLTTTGVVLGTPWYLAPEQARGAERLDARVDVWALGAVLYEMLTGRVPFERESPIATVVAILHDQLEPLRARAPRVPPELAAVVEKCLEKDPQMRWPSMGALREALEELRLPEEGGSRRTTLPPMRPGEAALGAVLWLELDSAQQRARAEELTAAWGGTLVELDDGTTLAFFGGECSRGDEARRAAEVALRLGARRAAIGVDRLEALESTLRGPALERARRLALDAAEEGMVLVDPEAAPLLTRRFVLEQAPEGWRLVERRPTTSHPPAPQPERPTEGIVEAAFTLPIGREPPLLGRDVELARLRDAVERFAEERSALAVLLEGPPGIGKRRLRREAQRMLRDLPDEVLVLRASAEGPAAQRAFGLFAEALRRRAQQGAARRGWPSLAPSVAPSERLQAVERLAEEALGPSDPALGQVVTFLAELLGVPAPETEGLRLARRDRKVMEDQLRQALDRVLEGWLARRPVALLFDHLQWADQASLDAFETFLERFADRPLLLLGTARPELRERRRNWLQGLDVERIELRGLSRRHVGQLAAAVAGRPLPREAIERLHAHTGGVPLFVEQIVATLRAQGRLESDEPLSTLPLTVEAAVQAHLDALPELVRGLCLRVGLLERAFDPPLVEALGVADAARVLEQARQRGLLEARPGPEGHRLYRFRSPLTAQVARRMLDEAQQRRLAERAATVLERRDDRDPWEVAVLWRTAGRPERAAPAFAEVAVDRRVPTDRALRAAEEALRAGVLPTERACEVALAQAEALGAAGRHEERAALLRDWGEQATDVSLRTRFQVEHAAARWWTGERDEALAMLARVVEGNVAARDQALAMLWRAQMLSFAGAHEAAEHALNASRELAPLDDSWLRGLIASTAGHVHAQTGRLDRSATAFAEAAALLDEAGDPRRAVNARANRATALNDLGAYEEAEPELRRAMEASARLGFLQGYAFQQANLAYALGRMGRLDEAAAAAEQALRFAQRHDDALLLGIATFYRLCVAVHGATKHPERLLEVAREGDRFANRLEQLEQPVYGALCRAVAGRALLEAGDPQAGVARLRAAAQRLEATPNAQEDPVEVFVHLARALEAAGDVAEAQATWRRAAALLRERADRIEQPRWREHFLQRVEAHALVVAHPAWRNQAS